MIILKQTIHEKLKDAPSDWDIILLGYHVDNGNSMVKEGNKNTKLKNGFLNLNYFTGTHGYIIKNKVLPILVKELPKT